MYFIFIFISPSVPKSSVKMSVNQFIKNKRPDRSTNVELTGIEIRRKNRIREHSKVLKSCSINFTFYTLDSPPE